MNRKDAILAQYSHFKDMPWVEKTSASHPPGDIILHADVIIDTFKRMDDAKLEKEILLFLDRVLAEVRLISIPATMEYWDEFDQQEKEDTIAAIAYLRPKLTFFKNLITQLHQEIVIDGTHPEWDRLLETPQFMEPMNDFFKIVETTYQEIAEFEEFLKKQKTSSSDH